MLDHLRRIFAKDFPGLLGDRSGTSVILTALIVPALLGFAGLAVDVTSWYLHKRIVHASANAAAIAAALEAYRGEPHERQLQAAATDAGRNGFDADAGDTVTVHQPPTSGAFAGNAGAVEVQVARRAPNFFAQFFADVPVTVRSRAVALADLNNVCVWVLDPEVKSAFKVAGGAQVAIDCGIIVNSSHTEALTQAGGGCVAADRIRIAGGYTGDCVSPLPRTGAAPARDPLAALRAPAYGSCDHRSKVKVNGGERVTLNEGVYCGAIEVASEGELVLNPGTYVLDGGGLRVSARGRVTGHGVFIYLTENSGTSASISLSADAVVDLSAPTDGDYAGMLFYHDRAAPTNVTHSLTGGSTMRLDGIAYFPVHALNFSGGAELSESPTVVIARTFSFTGHSTVKIADRDAARANKVLVRGLLVE